MTTIRRRPGGRLQNFLSTMSGKESGWKDGAGDVKYQFKLDEDETVNVKTKVSPFPTFPSVRGEGV